MGKTEGARALREGRREEWEVEREEGKYRKCNRKKRRIIIICLEICFKSSTVSFLWYNNKLFDCSFKEECMKFSGRGVANQPGILETSYSSCNQLSLQL